MKSIEEIRDEMAIEHGWKNRHEIDEAYKNNSISQYSFDDYIEDVAKIFAKSCCEAQRIACAENANIANLRGDAESVYKSILETPLTV